MRTVKDIQIEVKRLNRLANDLTEYANDYPTCSPKYVGLCQAADDLLDYVQLLESFKVLEPEDIE